MDTKEDKLNYKELFENLPACFLILEPNVPLFTIKAVSNYYLDATMTKREEIIGKGLFEVFPDNPDDKSATGTSNLHKSLLSVIATKAPHVMDVQKYDIQKPIEEGGGFEERYWNPINTPLLSNNEIVAIIHKVHDITEFIRINKEGQRQNEIIQQELNDKVLYLKTNQSRINKILRTLIRYTQLDFSEKIETTGYGDELDSIGQGLNTLSEELKKYIQKLIENEELQKNSNNFLNAILENIPNMVFVKEANELRFVRFNKAGEELLGIKREQLLDKNDFDLFPTEQADFFVKKDRETIANKQLLDIEQELINTKDGQKWLHTKKIPLLDKNNEPNYLLGISEDITEQIKSREKLLNAAKEIEDLYNNAPCGYLSVDSTIYLSNINQTLLNWMGYESNEVIGKLKYEDLLSEKSKKEFLESFARDFDEYKKNGQVNDLEFEFQRKDGTKFPVIVNSVAVFNEQGDFIKSRSTVFDNTERKKVLEQLEIANKELESFSYSVSHDLRAPLRAIHGYSKILEEDYINKLDEEGKRTIEAILRNSKRMGDLIDDLLAFSRLGKKELSTSPTQMNLFVNEIYQEIILQEKINNAELSIETISNTSVDRTLFKQVWINLISNALKFSSNREQIKIKIGSCVKDDCIEYFVQDNGVGFDMRYADKLFGVFQRLHSQEEFQGTGVGLAIVKRIITKHHGKIWAHSKLNEGTTFYFTLPINNLNPN